MRLRKYEIRMSVTKNLYEKISLEAKYRDTKMANIAREKLAKHFLQHEILANPVETADNQQEVQINRMIQAQFMRAEKKLFSAIAKIENRFALIQEQIRFFTAMLDLFYFDLMKFLPDIPEELICVAIASANLRHSKWLESVENILKA